MMDNKPPRRGRPPKSAAPSAVSNIDDATLHGVLIRLNTLQKTLLDRSTGEFGLTQTEYFCNIMQYVESLPAEERTRIAKGLAEEPIKLVARLFTLVNAANHTFSVRRWLRCLDDHLVLLEEARKYPDLAQWVQYRLAYVYHSNAIDLRLRALKAFSRKETDLGRRYLLLALDYLEEAYSAGEQVVGSMEIPTLFNRLCHRSFGAQIRTELALFTEEIPGWPSVKTTRKIRTEMDALFTHSAKTIERLKIEEILVDIPGLFDMLSRDHRSLATTQLITNLISDAVKAMLKLKELLVADGGHGSASWVIDSLESDIDCAFLRKITQPESYHSTFHNLLTELRGHNTEEQMLTVYRKFLPPRTRWLPPAIEAE